MGRTWAPAGGGAWRGGGKRFLAGGGGVAMCRAALFGGGGGVYWVGGGGNRVGRGWWASGGWIGWLRARALMRRRGRRLIICSIGWAGMGGLFCWGRMAGWGWRTILRAWRGGCVRRRELRL